MDKFINGPVNWFRNKVVDPNRGESYPWYHRQYNRVPGIEECYTEDVVCREEANFQFKRDRMVEQEILSLLRERKNEGYFYEKGTGLSHMRVRPQIPLIDIGEGSTHVCKPLSDTYERLNVSCVVLYF